MESLFEDSFYGAVPLLRHVSESLMKKKIQATLDISNKKNSVSGALPQNWSTCKETNKRRGANSRHFCWIIAVLVEDGSGMAGGQES